MGGFTQWQGLGFLCGFSATPGPKGGGGFTPTQGVYQGGIFTTLGLGVPRGVGERGSRKHVVW